MFDFIKEGKKYYQSKRGRTMSCATVRLLPAMALTPSRNLRDGSFYKLAICFIVNNNYL